MTQALYNAMAAWRCTHAINDNVVDEATLHASWREWRTTHGLPLTEEWELDYNCWEAFLHCLEMATALD